MEVSDERPDHMVRNPVEDALVNPPAAPHPRGMVLWNVQRLPIDGRSIRQSGNNLLPCLQPARAVGSLHP